MPFFFTPTGYRKLNTCIERQDQEVRKVQSQGQETAELGNAWHDNPAYEQMVIDLRGADRRLADLQEIRNQAQVVQINSNPETVTIGTWITLKKDDHTMTVGIVGYQQSDAENDLIAYDTPLAKFLSGLRKGEKKEGEMNQRKISVEVISIEPLAPEREGASHESE